MSVGTNLVWTVGGRRKEGQRGPEGQVGFGAWY